MKKTGKIVYYALILSGRGRGKPPLPVAESISNSHEVIDVQTFFSNWYYQFKKLCRVLIWKIEINFSYLFLHSISSVFNNKTLQSYITR